MYEGPTMAIVWLMTPAMVAIGGFCAGLAFHAISRLCREAVFVFLRCTSEPHALRPAQGHGPFRSTAYDE
jgi:hypothetical protein